MIEDSSSKNNEIVMFRNAQQSSLKPSYVMYIADDKLDSEQEQENIAQIRNQMNEAGLNVPLIIFDRYSIREKMRQNESEHTVEGR